MACVGNLLSDGIRVPPYQRHTTRTRDEENDEFEIFDQDVCSTKLIDFPCNIITPSVMIRNRSASSDPPAYRRATID